MTEILSYMNGISVFTREDSEMSLVLSAMEVPCEKTAIYDRVVRNKFLMFTSHPVFAVLLQQPEWIKMMSFVFSLSSWVKVLTPSTYNLALFGDSAFTEALKFQ
jgi:hypothetical protein